LSNYNIKYIVVVTVEIVAPQQVQISNLVKIRPFGGQLFHADRNTDMTKKNVAFRCFAKAPKNRNLFPSAQMSDVQQHLLERR
jgi:hypothetical protein